MARARHHPGQQGAHSYIVCDKVNPESLEYGAARAMSRGEAKRRRGHMPNNISATR